MKTAARLRVGSVSDTGLRRTINEDRVWCDEARGIFLVVDGLGGHAAGETAAQTAVDVISQHLNPGVASELESHIKAVISTANNEIFRLSEENREFRGMACVLTLAVMSDGNVVVGHVGDSRLYLFSNGILTKITSDHSPVGEQEDEGLLTEEEAMRHPRRNEVFRDVGSVPRLSDDDLFIETRNFPFREDAALLLCSDGLTDCVNAAEIASLLRRYDGDADRVAQLLIEAANAAGGKDNISVIFIAGPAFIGADARKWKAARARHATTRQRSESSRSALRIWMRALLIAFICAGAALLAWWFIVRATSVPAVTTKAQPGTPHRIEVSASDARGIIEALSTAVSGDTISVPPGEYLGPLILKDGVDIVAKSPGEAVVRSDATATIEQGNGVVAQDVKHGLLSGLKIVGDDTHPLKIGVLLVDSSVDVENLDVSGAVYSGIQIEGDSEPRLVQNVIHGNGGAGVTIGDDAAPLLLRNQITQNGLTVNAEKPGIETGPLAKPILDGNLITGNGTDAPQKVKRSDPQKHPGEH